MFITGLIFRGSRGLLLSSCRCDSQVRIQAMSLGWCKSPGNPSNQFLPSPNGTKDAASKGAQTGQAGQERSREEAALQETFQMDAEVRYGFY